MNKMRKEVSEQLDSKNFDEAKNLITESTIGSPSKDTMNQVENEIRKFNHGMSDLERRKQDLIREIQINEKKMRI